MCQKHLAIKQQKIRVGSMLKLKILFPDELSENLYNKSSSSTK